MCVLARRAAHDWGGMPPSMKAAATMAAGGARGPRRPRRRQARLTRLGQRVPILGGVRGHGDSTLAMDPGVCILSALQCQIPKRIVFWHQQQSYPSPTRPPQHSSSSTPADNPGETTRWHALGFSPSLARSSKFKALDFHCLCSFVPIQFTYLRLIRVFLQSH